MLHIAHSRFLAIFLALSLAIPLLIQSAHCDPISEESFLPTWKLLKADEKERFIAGYVLGWRDAAKVTDIAIEYVKENPDKAVEGLEKIRGVYGLSDLKPDILTHEVDQYFTDPNNRSSSLSSTDSGSRTIGSINYGVCMIDSEDLAEVFEKITETYEEPVPIGGRCESNVYYRVEDLTDRDLDICARYVAERIRNVIAPQKPELFLKLPGGYTFFAERLCAIYSELYPGGKEIALEQYFEKKMSNGHGEKYKKCNAILVTDVITTARSSLEAHTRATLRGIPVLCWATLIDRTFGPGPVPVVSSFTGAPVRVLTRLG